MDGLFFYWIVWIALVWTMFFVPKTDSNRLTILLQLLIIVVLTRYQLMIFSYSVQLSGLYVFFLMCFVLRNLSIFEIVRLLVHCFIIALAYSTFQLYALLDPIWVILNPIYLHGLILNYLVLLLERNGKRRVAVLILGMIIGDLVYAGLLTHQTITYRALSFGWHDTITFALLVQFAWSYLEYLSKLLIRLSKHRVLFKEKQG